MFHFLNDPAGDFVGRLALRLTPRHALIFQERIEVLAFGGAGCDKHDFNTEPRQFRANRFGEAVQRELAGRVFAFVRAPSVAKDRTDVDD